MTSTDEHERGSRPSEKTPARAAQPFVVSSVTTRPKGTRRRYTVILSAHPDSRQRKELPAPSTSARRPRPGPGTRPPPRPDPPLFGFTPTNDAVAATARAQSDPPPRRSAVAVRRRRWPVIVALTGFALSIGVPLIVQAFFGNDPDSRNTRAATDLPAPIAPVQSGASEVSSGRAAAVVWVRRYLSPRAVVVTDAATVISLRRSGFSSVSTFGTPVTGGHPAGRYVLDVHGVTVPGGTAVAARTRALGHSVPLAIFGTDAQRATVRQTVSFGLREASVRRADDLALRSTGGQELLQNSALAPDAAMRNALRKGAIDLRAQNVLSDLASVGRVQVSAPVRDPGETSAGQPIRSFVISTRDLEATRSILQALPSPFRPVSTVAVIPRGLRVVWTPTAATDIAAGD